MAGSQPSVPVPASALPDFATPKYVVSDGFFSNLKQFLTERPIKLNGNVNSTLMPPSYGGGFADNLKEFFSSTPVPKGPVNSRLAVSWGSNFGGFGYRLKEFFAPTKLPPLQVTSKPIKVKEIWSKDENFGWTQILSVALHAGIMALLIIPFFIIRSTDVQAKGPAVDVTPLDISDYVSKLPAGANKAGGGGGGGDREVLPPSKGRAPKFKWTQFTPPEAHPNPAPKLPMDASLLGPPDLKVQNPNLTNMGDPLANAPNLSGGSGGGGGLAPAKAAVSAAAMAAVSAQALVAARAAACSAQAQTASASRNASIARLPTIPTKPAKPNTKARFCWKLPSPPTAASSTPS